PHCRMAHWRTPCGTRSVQVRKLPSIWIYKQHTSSLSVRIRNHHIDRQLGASLREVLYDNLAVYALLVFLALAVADHQHGAIHAHSTEMKRQDKASLQAGIDDVGP